MRRNILGMIFGVVYAFAFAKELPDIDLSRLEDVQDFQISARATNDKYGNLTQDVNLLTRTQPGIVNVRYQEGRLYVNATQIHGVFAGGGDVAGVFHSTDGKNPVFEWEWTFPSHYIDSKNNYFFDYSFNCKAEGTARFQVQFDSATSDRSEVQYLELALEEGLNVNFRVDGFYPSIFDEVNEWLYGKASSDGKLSGEYAVEKFDGVKTIEDKVYHILKRSENISYSPEQSYEIAYMRFDGRSLKLLPIDTPLAFGIWVEGMNGAFTPIDDLGREELPLMDVYNSADGVAFKDVINNRIEILSTESVVDDFDWYDRDYLQYWSQQYDMTRQKADMQLTRTVNLSGGLSLIESVGMVGNCANSLAYPVMISDEWKGANVQKLIRMYKIKDNDGQTSKRTIYQNDDLASQFDAYISGVNAIEMDGQGELRFYEDNVSWTIGEEGMLTLTALDGEVVKKVPIKESGEISVADLSSGMYIVTLQTSAYKQTIKIIK